LAPGDPLIGQRVDPVRRRAAASCGIPRADVPQFWQDLLGNGVFLVIGWVGLWYPLDLLFFARQPLKREARIVEAVSQMPLVVQPADIP